MIGLYPFVHRKEYQHLTTGNVIDSCTLRDGELIDEAIVNSPTKGRELHS